VTAVAAQQHDVVPHGGSADKQVEIADELPGRSQTVSLLAKNPAGCLVDADLRQPGSGWPSPYQ
jgi:hypothetical protein